jgi:MFS family permease
MAVGLVMLGVSLAPLGCALSIPAQLLLLSVLGIASGLIITPALTGLGEVIDRGEDHAYGVAYALFNTAYAAGLALGPLAGGVLTDTLGFPVAMLGAACLPLAMGVRLAIHR